jgi:signal transduction histidine kinase
LFLLVAYFLFSTARRSEQNRVWVGMSKETAHQLGTPLFSLLGWIEILKSQGVDESVIEEITKDVDRLQMIAERFSKVGSIPELKKENLLKCLQNSVNYMRVRTSDKIQFGIHGGTDMPEIMLNKQLFEWVIENICRNAVDAIQGKGSISFDIYTQGKWIIIDISDTGKGIPKNKWKTIFRPGFTTKQRGWGLGLSLTKRIIEEYHKGKIYVKNSEQDHGTTFRIQLRKAF